jgi:hypothetical protein
VQECVARWQAQQQSERIAAFRHRAEAFAQDLEQLGWIRAQLHLPTMQLRQGQTVNEDEFFQHIQDSLERVQSPYEEKL